MLDTATSVVVILDDVDEYVENNKHIPKDILNIIENNPRLELILTARSFSKELVSQSKRLRLSGFTSEAQDKYLRKAVTKDDRTATDNIKCVIRCSPVLRDICQVPLYFVLFAHLSHSSKQFPEYKSVTSFFRYIDSSLHLRGKTDTDYGTPDHKELNRIAFESLSGYNRRNSWRKENLSSQIGRRALKHFLQTGILQEKIVLQYSDNSLSRQDVKTFSCVSFYHDLFLEWYAALHLVDMLVSPDITDDDDVMDIMDELDHLSLQYVYRFACGMNSLAGNHIIKYFSNLNRREEIIIMCILEQRGSPETVLDIIKEICSNMVQLSTNNSTRLNKATLQLLETAVSQKIEIPMLLLSDCFQSVNVSTNMLILTSGLQVPNLNTLHGLHITQTGREFTEEQMTDIFIYVTNSINLKTVKFTDCLFPGVYQNKFHLQKLSELKVTVLWYPLRSWYRLNLQSGGWEEKIGSVALKEKVYERKAAQFRAMYKQE
ncbi:uncharacterized protein [Apostichopus japonicus]|uniref:uncharacterized protein n=1 Tax=Stichopus japonicus TaxID=307972 RepID=UPI003AB421E6